MQDFNSVKLKPPWKDVKTLCEYIWIDGDMILRSKTKVFVFLKNFQIDLLEINNRTFIARVVGLRWQRMSSGR